MFIKSLALLYSVLHLAPVASVATEIPCEIVLVDAYDSCLYPEGLPVMVPSNSPNLRGVSGETAFEEPSEEKEKNCLSEAMGSWSECINSFNDLN